MKEKIVACSQIIKGIKSVYLWKNKIEKSKECLSLLKTSKSTFTSVREKIISMHPYQIPEIVSLDIEQIETEYAKWIDETLLKNE